MRGAQRAGVVVASAFRAAGDRDTGGDYRCRNGDAYGIGILARLPSAATGSGTDAGLYAVQDPGDPEERAWLCLNAAGLFTACTTHLANTVAGVTVAQCEGPGAHRRGAGSATATANAPLVMAGDFNLRSGGSPDARVCLTDAFTSADDGGAQHVASTADAVAGPATVIDLHGVTDHPALLVTLRFR